jgi:hypothetical protein
MSERTNPERTVNCPVPGCNAEKLARGIHLHVRQSKGDGHGPQGEIPDEISLKNLETVGSKEVSMDYPETRETEQVGRRCPYCNEVFRGKQGVMIHLGRSAGKGPHPTNAKDQVDAEDLTVVHVDDDGSVIGAVEEPTVMPSTRQRRDREAEEDLRGQIQAVIEEFRQEGKDAAADRLEDVLDND